VFQLRIQIGPPTPERFYIRVVLTIRNNAPITSKEFRTVVAIASRVCAMFVDLLLPCAAKLRAAIAWIEPPFIDEKTTADELRGRIGFCLDDARKAKALGEATP